MGNINMFKKMIVIPLLLLFMSGCGEDNFSDYDLKNITGTQFYYAVERFKDEPIGIIIERRGTMHYYGAKIEEFNEDTLTAKLSSERYPETPRKILKNQIPPRDVFDSQIIRDVNGKVIGLYLFSTKRFPPFY
jgi:hypothetical protein